MLKCAVGVGGSLVVGAYWITEYMCRLYGRLSVRVSASQLSLFMFQLCLQGSFTTLDNFITAHSVLFILITGAAKVRHGIQTFPESDSRSLSQLLVIRLDFLYIFHLFPLNKCEISETEVKVLVSRPQLRVVSARLLIREQPKPGVSLSMKLSWSVNSIPA